MLTVLDFSMGTNHVNHVKIVLLRAEGAKYLQCFQKGSNADFITKFSPKNSRMTNRQHMTPDVLNCIKVQMIQPQAYSSSKRSAFTNLASSVTYPSIISKPGHRYFFQQIFYRNRNLITMGQACSACQQKNVSLQEIKAVEEDNKPNTSTTKMVNKKMEPTIKEPPPSHKQCQQSKKGEKRKEVSVLTSKINQTRTYQKMGNLAVKLDVMPDFSNEIVRAKKAEFGGFQYNKPELEVLGVESLGALQFEKRYVYQGQWKNNERNGRGVQQWKDGSLYEGYWKNNVAFGYGRLIHADGDVYIGEWLDDRASGKGLYYSYCGARYDGEWKDDKQHGYGEQTWPDQAIYKGQYVHGRKQGKGTFLWEDDSCYQGQFFENNIHGFGKYIWKDGRTYEGEWKNNKMDGKGVFTWLDGRKYEGQYKDDRKEGFGIFHFRDGRIYEGEWKNGKQHGKGLIRKKNLVRQGIWQSGDKVKWTDDTKQNEEANPAQKEGQ